MARLVELGGAPVNPMERETIQRLVRELPKAGYTVIPNVSLPDRHSGHPYEFDAIIVAPHAVYALEMKGWSGRIRQLGQADWERSPGRIERNPLPLIDHKARILSGLFKSPKLGAHRPPYVQACLVVGTDQAILEIPAPDDRRCLRPSELAPYLSDPTRLSTTRTADDHSARHDLLVKLITGELEARVATGRRFGSYVTTSLESRSDDGAIWLAKHALLDDGRVYRLRSWYLSPYHYDSAAKESRVASLRRSAEALARVGDHANIATLRDFGEHDGEFVEVTDWSVHGTLETAFVRGRLRSLDVAKRLHLMQGVASGLAAAQAHGVIHRSLGPERVLLEPDGDAGWRPRVTGFDLAWVERAAVTVFAEAPEQSDSFRAPELRNPKDYEVFDNTDLYAFGKMFQLVFQGVLPQETLDLLAQCVAVEPDRRPAQPMDVVLALREHRDGSSVRPPPLPPPEDSTRGVPPQPAVPGPGDVIDGVNTILEVLGRGAGSVVFRAFSEPLGRDVALKLIVDPERSGDPASEYHALRAANSPHLATAHWLGRTADGRRYLILDLIEGPTLRDLLRREPIPFAAACRLLRELASAIAALHAADYVHRDVKPDNVIVGPNGAVLVDAGSARPTSAGGSAPEGTLAYTPPWLSRTGWVAAADWFSFAVLAWECLTGTLPWGGLPHDVTPPRLGPPISEPLANLLAGALAGEPFSTSMLLDALDVAPAPTPRGVHDVEVDLAAPDPAPEEAGPVAPSLWTAARIVTLTSAADPVPALFETVLEAIATASSFIDAERRLHAFEVPLQTAMPTVYDRLCLGGEPVRWQGGSPATLDANVAVWEIEHVHPCDWPLLIAAGATVQVGVVAPALITREPARARRFALPLGERTSSLDALWTRRRETLMRLIGEARAGSERVWLLPVSGAVYLGAGLRTDVAEGLGDNAGLARSAWSSVFGDGRSAPAASAPVLPCRLDRPTRIAQNRLFPIGRLMWADSPNAPWLATGGLSLGERLVPLALVEP